MCVWVGVWVGGWVRVCVFGVCVFGMMCVWVYIVIHACSMSSSLIDMHIYFLLSFMTFFILMYMYVYVL